MEGPTPVSALIHAATLVTAGIFLIIRCSALFEECPIVLSIITIMGSLTAFFAASVGLVQNDLKNQTEIIASLNISRFIMETHA